MTSLQAFFISLSEVDGISSLLDLNLDVSSRRDMRSFDLILRVLNSSDIFSLRSAGSKLIFSSISEIKLLNSFEIDLTSLISGKEPIVSVIMLFSDSANSPRELSVLKMRKSLLLA